ncbi:MAG: hypothetical protein K2J44_03695, partial [Ruminococcus sp.]|nr:hypothetical protein [Ruminococcus sp.]
MLIKLLFFIVIIMTVSASVIFITDIKKIIPSPPETEKVDEENTENQTEEPSPIQAKKLFTDICIIFTVLLGISDITGLIDTGMFHGAFAVTGTALLLEKACNLIRSRIQSRTVKFFGKIILIASLLEITVFQFPSYRIFFGEYKQQTLSVSDATAVNTESDEISDNIKVKGKETTTVKFDNINKKVGTIKINVETANSDSLSVNVDATDETSALYRPSIIRADVVTTNLSTAYTTVLLSGNVGSLQFNFSGKNDYDLFDISSVELNTPIPFEISFLRMILIIIIST